MIRGMAILTLTFLFVALIPFVGPVVDHHDAAADPLLLLPSGQDARDWRSWLLRFWSLSGSSVFWDNVQTSPFCS